MLIVSWARKIEDVSQFTSEQLIKIADALFNNGQVSSSWNARPILKRILENNMHILPSEERLHLEELL